MRLENNEIVDLDEELVKSFDKMEELDKKGSDFSKESERILGEISKELNEEGNKNQAMIAKFLTDSKFNQNNVLGIVYKQKEKKVVIVTKENLDKILTDMAMGVTKNSSLGQKEGTTVEFPVSSN